MMCIKSFSKLALIGGASIALVMTPAAAQSTKKRVEALEGEVAELKASATAATVAGQRLDVLEAEIRRLTGDVETLQFQLDQANARIDSMSAVLAGEPLPPRVGDPIGSNLSGLSDPAPGVAVGGPVALTGNAGAASANGAVDGAAAGDLGATGAPGQGQNNAPADVELPLDPEAAFGYANNLVLARDFARAETAFQLYLQTFSGHPRAADAQFRLGEIYLATGRNAEAAEAFIAHIRDFPGHSRAAEAYLKLGTSFSRLGQSDQACNVFRTMNSKYPNAPVGVADRARREMQAAGCN